MIRVPAGDLRPDMVLARSACDPRNPEKILLPRGQRLPERVIPALRRLGLRSLWIEAPGSETLDALVDEATLELHRRMLQSVNDVFRAVRRDPAAAAECIAARARVIALWEILRRNPLAAFALDDLEGGPDSPACHAVGVCALSMLLHAGQREAGKVAAAEAAAVGLGALFHDLGEALLPEELLQKAPWDRTQRERKEFETHPERGAALLRPHLGIVAASVALGHHRLAGGAGYPREDGNDNHLLGGERADARAAMLAAAADAFDRLVTLENCTPIEALEELFDARRGQFEVEVLAALARVVPPFPPGTPVRIASGHGGVAAGWDPADPFNPPILLLFQPDGTPLPPGQRREVRPRGHMLARIVRAGGRPVEHLVPAGPQWEGVS